MAVCYESDIRPFKMYGNLYFVGSSKVSVHLIKTNDGLVLIDTGYPDMYEQILYSIRALGFDPKNIVAIFHSHGHIDHFGCTQRIKKLSGAKTYISYVDQDIINGKRDLSWAIELGLERLPPFVCDVSVKDGDIFQFGNTIIRCVLTPGHTDGVLSFFVNIEDGDNSIVAAMHGGIGMNSLAADFLNKYGLSFSCRDVFRTGLHILAKEHVDLVIGNHPQQNDTEGKLRRVMACEPILDPNEWQVFLNAVEKNLDDLIESEK